jgi:hypothetical protein
MVPLSESSVAPIFQVLAASILALLMGGNENKTDMTILEACLSYKNVGIRIKMVTRGSRLTVNRSIITACAVCVYSTGPFTWMRLQINDSK